MNDANNLADAIPTTFQNFSKLPPELRLMTWDIIANIPRTITFDWLIKKSSAPTFMELESKVKFLAFGGQQFSPRFENYQWVLWRFNNLWELTLLERRPDVQNNGGFWSIVD